MQQARSPRLRVLKWVAALFVFCFLFVLAFSWWVGGQLLAHRPALIGMPPDGLAAQGVQIPVADGTISGWWLRGDDGKPSVLLLHGIRADRRAMLERARLLSRHGYSVLLIDLPAHGQSTGKAITLGLHEAVGVQAARTWILSHRPGQKIAAIGVSLGGASILLGPSPAGFDAVVLEAVYADAKQALDNRMSMRFGSLGPILGRLLEVQIEPRIGINLRQLRPIDHIAGIGAPVMVIAGAQDRHTTPAESAALFARANAPKEYWLVPGAAHQDFLRVDPVTYERRVLGFLGHHLSN